MLQGVMFNAYPDSIGTRLADTVAMLKRPEFAGAFSLFYILPTFFNSDLDRGFSIIDYELNEELVSVEDLEQLNELGIHLKFDLVLNHLSVGSHQFQDMLRHGDDSQYKDFFIDWNEFWAGHGEMGPEGYVIPKQEHLDRLFTRKPGLPILNVRFPDGSTRSYWNTFYQEVAFQKLEPEDLQGIAGIEPEHAQDIATLVNHTIAAEADLAMIDWGRYAEFSSAVLDLVERRKKYLGQMDLNARSEKVWDFYDETLAKLRAYGAKLVRLDAFAYLHKQPGMVNFFNKPGTWDYLERLKESAKRHDVYLLPEIHSEYGHGLHEEVAGRGFTIYDFFFPALVIDALDRGINRHLLRWMAEIMAKGIKTVNMLGCHDGIPVLDIRGKQLPGIFREGLMSDEEIDAIIERIISRGGRVKNLFCADGRKIAYYQVNATFFSALGEDERKLRLARAIQMFMPGVPQVWYLDLFAGRNDYVAADNGGAAGHKEINRTTLSQSDIDEGLKRILVRDQLQLIKLRNSSPAFGGEPELHACEEHRLHLSWRNRECIATLEANLRDFDFTITHGENGGEESMMRFL